MIATTGKMAVSTRTKNQVLSYNLGYAGTAGSVGNRFEDLAKAPRAALEGVEHVGIEVRRHGAPVAYGDDLHRGIVRQRLLVRARRAQGVVLVADVHDAGRERDQLPFEPPGVAAAVPALVVVHRDLGAHAQVRRIARADELRAERGV